MKLQTLVLFLSACFTLISAAIVGVDFGQEYTKSVLVAPGVPFEIILTADSKRKDVSGLGFKPLQDGTFERLYGSSSVSHCVKSPKSCLLALKALIGKSIDDASVPEYLAIHKGVSLKASKGNRNTISFDMDKMGTYSIEEGLAMSLGDIKKRAQELVESKISSRYSVNDIVITVPTFFTQAQRQAIIDGAEVAGLKVIGLVDDGVAVAVNYVSSRAYDDAKEYHIVYDMGAGSTKATLFSVRGNATTGGSIVEIEAVGYDDSLSGELLTKSVFDILTEKFLAQHKKTKTKDFTNNARAMARLWQAAEKAKLVLSANNEATVSVESIYNDIDFKATITRDEFQEYNSDLMPRVTAPLLEIFDYSASTEASVTLKDVESVILTGGSTRVPFVQKHLASLVGDDKLAKNVNSDEAAVMGATLRGVILSGMFRAKDISVIDKSFYNYEAVIGSQRLTVFPKGSVLGETITLELDTIEDDSFTVDLYENGVLYQTLSYSDIKKTLGSIKDSNTVRFVATFTLSHSRLFTLDKIQLKTEAKKSFIEKLTGSSTEEQELNQVPLENGESVVEKEGSSANTTDETSAEKNSSKKKAVTLTPKKSYAQQQPMSGYLKESAIETLKELASKDTARMKKETLRNELESALYDLRSYADDNSDQSEKSDLFAEAENLVTEYLEWLDYDSDLATVKVLKLKLDDVKVLKAKLLAFLEFSNKVAEAGIFNDLHKRALSSMHAIQDVMLTMAEDASSLKQNLTAIGLDWEEENKKVKVTVPPLDDKEVQMVFMSLNNDIEDLISKKLIQTEDSPEDKSEDYEKDELFAMYETISSKVDKLDEFKKSLEKVHAQRTSALTKVYRKNFVKKLREAEAAAAAAADAEKTEDITETEERNEAADDQQAEAAETSEHEDDCFSGEAIESDDDANVHDEL